MSRFYFINSYRVEIKFNVNFPTSVNESGKQFPVSPLKFNFLLQLPTANSDELPRESSIDVCERLSFLVMEPSEKEAGY